MVTGEERYERTGKVFRRWTAGNGWERCKSLEWFPRFSIWVKEGRRYLSLKEETRGKALLGVFWAEVITQMVLSVLLLFSLRHLQDSNGEGLKTAWRAHSNPGKIPVGWTRVLMIGMVCQYYKSHGGGGHSNVSVGWDKGQKPLFLKQASFLSSTSVKSICEGPTVQEGGRRGAGM